MKDLWRQVGQTVRAALASWLMTVRLCVLIAAAAIRTHP
jgi:ABC-type Fe3+ transport system permease subunit